MNVIYFNKIQIFEADQILTRIDYFKPKIKKFHLARSQLDQANSDLYCCFYFIMEFFYFCFLRLKCNSNF